MIIRAQAKKSKANIVLKRYWAFAFLAEVVIPLHAFAQATPAQTAQRSTPANASFECAFGQKDLADQLRTAEAIKSDADALAAAAKTDEAAREKRMKLAMEAVDAALMAQSVGRDPARYWALLKQSLADTRWRMVKAGKTDSDEARWAYAELAQQETAKPWDAKACASLGAFKGQANAGMLYRAALCQSEKTPDVALHSMQKAADAGHPAAQEAYGRLCAANSPEAKACAVKYLCLAADAGRVSAAGLAAYLLTEQKPSVAMAVKAAALYEKAVNAGDLASANNLAEVYELGWIGTADLVKAERFYRLAAEANVAQAQLNLARLLASKDLAQARSWIEKARASLPKESAQLEAKLFKDE
jgi:uncharacterized protein